MTRDELLAEQFDPTGQPPWWEEPKAAETSGEEAADAEDT